METNSIETRNLYSKRNVDANQLSSINKKLTKTLKKLKEDIEEKVARREIKNIKENQKEIEEKIEEIDLSKQRKSHLEFELLCIM